MAHVTPSKWPRAGRLWPVTVDGPVTSDQYPAMAGTEKLVALLRGVNVGGHRRLPMVELRALLESCGYRDVRTYIQSGNVVCSAPITGANRASRRRAQIVEKTMTDAIFERFALTVPVMVRRADEWPALVADNPFLAANKGVDKSALYVGFMSKTPEPQWIEAIDRDRSPPDQFAIRGREIYLYYPERRQKSKLVNDWFERELRVDCTMRNWRTVNRLLAMLDS